MNANLNANRGRAARLAFTFADEKRAFSVILLIYCRQASAFGSAQADGENKREEKAKWHDLHIRVRKATEATAVVNSELSLHDFISADFVFIIKIFSIELCAAHLFPNKS